MPFTISLLKVHLHLNLSEWQPRSPFQSKKNYFTSNFMQNLTIHFGNIKSWYNYSTTMFAKYTSTNQMVLHQLKLELFEKKVHKGILHFSKCTVFLIWLWLKIVLVFKLISYHHLYSGLSSPGIFDKKHGCMIEISLTCVSCKGELLCTIFSLPILIKIIISHVSICLKIYFFPLQFSESEWCPLTYSPSNCHQMDQ